MAGVPINFALPSENAIATFNYTDIENGLGYTTFYCTQATDNTATTYFMTSFVDDSSSYIIQANNSGATFNFDTSVFNAPKVAKGTAFVCFSGYESTTSTSYADVTLYKVDASSNETAISSTYRCTDFGTATTGSIKFMAIPITSQTSFKKGEKLRLKFYLYVSTSNVYVGCSPTNSRPSTAVAGYQMERTKFTLQFPFRIDT